MKQIMDGCTAATHVAFALSDVATIYPITPIAEMGQIAQKWGLIDGRRNLMGQPLDVQEMESELGAAGATHGALMAGALATTFTCSQGLLLMIPNMFKIAGEQLPGVFHVGTRSIASHALSIFGDHQDVMATRSTGFAFLASASVQETMDLALVAHLAAIDGSLPVVHFMDGWRTSNEMATIDVIDYETMRPLVDWDKVTAFRRRAINPEHPDQHGTAQNPGVFFQNREACNPFYDKFPAIVQAAMDRVGKAIGREYHLVDYYGAPDADRVMVIIGSGGMVAREAVDYLNARDEKVGVVQVRLFQPFPAEAFLKALPATVKSIAVMDRTKEPGAMGEPLYLACVTALYEAGRTDIRVAGGRYGLSSKDFTPSMVNDIFAMLAGKDIPRMFTVGINDDVTHLSLTPGLPIDTTPKGAYQAVFYGMGSDGTVGSTKLAADIIGNAESLYAQAYFEYSAKKSGGYTISQLRFGHEPITSAYMIEHADYVGCNKDVYVNRFNMLDVIKPGGTFVLNSDWDLDMLEKKLPASMKRQIASKKLEFYNINAAEVAEKVGLGVRINTVMITAFLYLCKVMPFDRAKEALEDRVRATYIHEGMNEVDANIAAIGAALSALTKVNYPSSWADAAEPAPTPVGKDFISRIARPCFELLGNDLPVSLFAPDGRVPAGTTAWEKRRIALKVPKWDPDKCVKCTLCSFVCPHAAIRPFLLTDEEKAAAPEGMLTVRDTDAPELAPYNYRIQVFPEDCTGCSSCALVCPGHALTMMPMPEQVEEQVPLLDYCLDKVGYRGGIIDRFSIDGSQFYQPLMEFSGACAGCGETPYVKLLTQLFGERLLIANATGCSSIWGGSFPSNPYCANAEGRGPAWANSLFEDNAEYGYGMACAVKQRRDRLREAAEALAGVPGPVQAAAQTWLDSFNDPDASRANGLALVDAIKTNALTTPQAQAIVDDAEMLGAKSVWAVGGDGWAYDIGFAGLDHVLASGANINILVLDTECYSNTGGQTSKATPLGSTAKYSPLGKRTLKKDLGRMMMTYTDVYVASVAMGGSFSQLIKAMKEAEEYPGPSIVIAYCPCIEHGIKLGLGHSILEEREAVKAGYWPLYRYNPSLKALGKDPLTVDCPEPDNQLIPYLNGENRYADLRMLDPEEAALLQPMLQRHLYSVLRHLRDLPSIPPA